MAVIFKEVWINTLYFVAPYLMFFFGIYIAHALKLYKNVTFWQECLMGVPVAFLYVTPILYTAYDSYTEDHFKLFLLFGNIIIIGTLTPKLFMEARTRVYSQGTTDKSTGTDKGQQPDK